MNDYKPLSERVAAKLATELKTGVSVLQRPENSPNSAMPFNIETGNRYPGASALILLMQKREDPRWATFNQANRNRTAVLKGATGTYINFTTQYEFQKAMKDGEPVLKPDGKPRFDKVRLDEPKEVEVKLFNGEQLRKLPKWERHAEMSSPAERAETILQKSGATIEHDGDEMSYRKGSDSLVLPEPKQFANQEQFLAEALHQLVHREMENQPKRMEQTMVKEELRANIASLFLAREIGLPFELNYHDGYANSWAQLMKDEPGELFKAAEDAQMIADKIIGYEKVIEQQRSGENGQETGAETGQKAGDDKQQDTTRDSPGYDPEKLTKGEIIPHNGTEFKVLAVLKNNVYNMQDLSDKRKFKMDTGSGLFASLINTRNHSQEAAVAHDFDHAEMEDIIMGRDEMDEIEEIGQSISR